MACTKGMRGCPLTCGHKAFVMNYAAEREWQETRAENDTTGETRATLTFRQYLTHTKGGGER